MRIVALEEAFDMEGLEGVASHREGVVDKEVAADWKQRLKDFSEWRIPEMDEAGIDVQVLSLTVPGIQGVEDAATAVRDAKTANDYLAGVIARYPDRFRGFAALPMQDAEAAAAELRRCVSELGFCGALVNDHTANQYYDEAQFAVVWSMLEELDVPLYIHPGAPMRDNWNLLKDHPELIGAAWSWGAEVGGHALRLIYGGVFDRHPRAKLILGHMGEFLPFQRWRLDSRYQTFEKKTLQMSPSHYFGRNILITTSGVASPSALAGAIMEIGEDAVMFSVDYPYESSTVALDFLKHAPLSDSAREKVAFRNAERVLKI